MVRYLFYTIGDLTYQSALVHRHNGSNSAVVQVAKLESGPV